MTRNKTSRVVSGRGFTLLEILVVVTLLALITAIALPTLIGESPDQRLQKAVKHFSDYSSLLADESMFLGQDLALRIDDHGYSAYRYDGDQQAFVPLQDNKALEPVDLPDDMTLDLKLQEDGQEQNHTPIKVPVIQDNGQDKSNTQDQMPPPQIFYLSSGDVTPFSLRFSLNGSSAQRTVNIDNLGRVQAEKPK